MVRRKHRELTFNVRPLRARSQRPCGSRTAEKRDEVAPFHQQFLPCFEAEDSTTGDLLHCGISKEPCPLWVINVECGRSATTVTVRFATKGDIRFKPLHVFCTAEEAII